MRRLRRPGDVAAFAQETAPDGVGRDKNVGRLGVKMVGAVRRKPKPFSEISR
jgi:hypothetical protein